MIILDLIITDTPNEFQEFDIAQPKVHVKSQRKYTSFLGRIVRIFKKIFKTK